MFELIRCELDAIMLSFVSPPILTPLSGLNFSCIIIKIILNIIFYLGILRLFSIFLYI